MKRKFSVWKTILIGTENNANALLKMTRYDEEETGYNMEKIINSPSFIISPIIKKIKLVKVTVSELGFKTEEKNPTYQEVCLRARQLGLKLCPSETGLQLRLQYEDQPRSEWLHIAMKPIPINLSDSGSYIGGQSSRKIFIIRHDPDEPIDISTGTIYENSQVSGYEELIFCIPENEPKKSKDLKFIKVNPKKGYALGELDNIHKNQSMISIPKELKELYFDSETEIVLYSKDDPNLYKEYRKDNNGKYCPIE